MAGRAGQKIKLTSIDELLCVPETEGTIDIDIRAIYPFENHPFKVVDDEKMDELVASIRENGVLVPVLLRPDEHGGESRSVIDPWYSGKFDDTYADVLKGCEAFLTYLEREGKITK